MICVSYVSYDGNKVAIELQRKKILEMTHRLNLEIQHEYNSLESIIEDGLIKAFDCIVFYSFAVFDKQTEWFGKELLYTFCPAGFSFIIAEPSYCSFDKTKRENTVFIAKEMKKSKCSTVVKEHKKKRNTDIYGYRIYGNSLIKDEAVMGAVNDIFTMAQKGISTSRIVNILTMKAIVPPHLYFDKNNVDKKWKGKEICEILQNPVYADPIMNYGKQAIDYKNAEPYVSVETWNRLQRKTDNAVVKQTFDLVFCRKNMLVIKELVEKEIKAAKKVKTILKSGMCKKYKEEIVKQEHNRLSDIFSELTIYNGYLMPVYNSTCGFSYDELLELLENKDRDFESIRKRIEFLELCFSTNNPWIIQFTNINKEDLTQPKQIRRFIDSANGNLIQLKNQEWKSVFPKEWLED